jgi:hypothetical protein
MLCSQSYCVAPLVAANRLLASLSPATTVVPLQNVQQPCFVLRPEPNQCAVAQDASVEISILGRSWMLYLELSVSKRQPDANHWSSTQSAG